MTSSPQEMIKELLDKLQLTHMEFAAKLGLKSTNTIWCWLNGSRSPSIYHCYKLIEMGKEVGLKIKLEDLKR